MLTGKEVMHMKKLLVLILSAALILASAACAESPDLFAEIQGKLFEFSSGAGAWSTELTVDADGSFTGSYHDSEMGETGEGYPDGTLYGCSFHGQFTEPARVDEYSWTAKVTLELDEGQVPEAIEDGVRYVTSVPYGIEKAQTVTFFVPGTPVDHLPEGFADWSHLQEIDPDATEIPYYAIWSEADEAGFITYPDAAEPDVPLAGGWEAAADPTVTEEIRALLDKGLNGMLGVDYEPVTYLGSQVVAGRNHAILCKATVVAPNAVPSWKIVYLYEDLQGNVSILNIADFDAGSLCTYGAEAE